MSFLSTDNRAVLSELVKENLTPDMMLFDEGHCSKYPKAAKGIF